MHDLNDERLFSSLVRGSYIIFDAILFQAETWQQQISPLAKVEASKLYHIKATNSVQMVPVKSFYIPSSSEVYYSSECECDDECQ